MNKLNVVLFFQNLDVYICFTHFFSLLQSNFFSQNISILFKANLSELTISPEIRRMPQEKSAWVFKKKSSHFIPFFHVPGKICRKVEKREPFDIKSRLSISSHGILVSVKFRF